MHWSIFPHNSLVKISVSIKAQNPSPYILFTLGLNIAITPANSQVFLPLSKSLRYLSNSSLYLNLVELTNILKIPLSFSFVGLSINHICPSFK